MSGSPLKKYILRPVVLSATVYAALTFPLAVLGAKPVTIKLQEEPVFFGQLKDIAPPYLGLASVISLGTGIASVAIAGWRQSDRKSSQVQAQLSELAQSLKKKEEQLEELKLSQTQLEASGLKGFLDEEVSQKPAKQSLDINQGTKLMVEPLVITTQPIEAQAAIPPQAMVQAAQFTSTQTSLDRSQAKASVKPNYQVNELAPSQVEELNSQLQQIMAQMVSVQAALSATRSTAR